MDVKIMVIIWALTIMANILAVDAHLDMKFRIHTKFLPNRCGRHFQRNEGSHGCRIPYAISLLTSPTSDFDLKALMMQDGFAKRQANNHHKIFYENTLVRIPQRIQIAKGDHVFAGLKLYNLPESVQDYYVVDVTKLVAHFQTAESVSISGDDFKFQAKIKNLYKARRYAKNGCTCQKMTCGCCEHVEIPKLEINDTACLNVTYLPDAKGFDFKFILNNIVLYEKEVSLRNPPPVCFQIPHLKDYASLCVRFHNITMEKDVVSACVGLEAELYHVKIYEHEFGCFHIPVLAFEPRKRISNKHH